MDTMIAELHARRNYLPADEVISSIYFGGGTPSLLWARHFEKIFYTVNQLFTLEENAEITFEANPDDLTENYFEQIRHLIFNRLSIGIQSFDDYLLKKINRRHTAQQAINAVQLAKKHGFTNISIDLIFGLPAQTLSDWQVELETAYSLDVQHISAYGLIYEEGTPLWRSRARGDVAETDEQTLNEMYLLLVQTAENQNFEHYEISNFARRGFRSRHNSGCWHGAKYLGVGAAAHSFDGLSRQWNVASIGNYIENVRNGTSFFEKEILTETDKYNEYVMVSLRTVEGVDFEYINKNFATKFADYFIKNIKQFISTNKVKIARNRYFLTKEGILISNSIISRLFA
jgi:oxygen-independent coproporphyrinogen-3 oxidase